MNNQVYTIPAGEPFAARLARFLLERWGADPLVFARVLVLLPSRRACLTLRQALLAESGGKPLLLPRLQPLGDVDEDALALSGLLPDALAHMPGPEFTLRRQMLLTRLVQAWQRQRGMAGGAEHSLRQADGLAKLLDELARHNLSLGQMGELVPETLAAHWQVTVEFLHILKEHWPAIAEERGLTSPLEARAQALAALAALWSKTPPAHPVVAAGTTGSIPATAALLGVIAKLPQGFVLLPGFEPHAPQAAREHYAPSHAQWGMQALLPALGVAPEEVQTLGGQGQAARAELLSRALYPAGALHLWTQLPPLSAAAAQGFTLHPCADEPEEAAAIALMLRETLEQPGRTAALVTHDRDLARRVCAAMLRYGIALDDSAGARLSQTPPAVFLRLLAATVEAGLAPVSLLALLKHPLMLAGDERLALLEATRALELAVLRGLRPEGGLAPLRAALELSPRTSPEAVALLARLEGLIAPMLACFAAQGDTSFAALLAAHMQAAQACAGDALWRGEEGEALAAFLSELQAVAADMPGLPASAYPGVLDVLMGPRVVRPDYGTHPRLKLLSPLEARMQSFDRVILGGLNEGSWPAAEEGDPWFSRPMRAQLGLPEPERAIGQAAHDFAMLACAPEVIVTRAIKQGGAPAAPARWWQRLEALLGHAGLLGEVESDIYARLARALDTPGEVTPCARPAPRPPALLRPRELPVTQVGLLLENPYAVYAAHILKLRKLRPLEQEPDAADFGSAVHKALELFTREHPARLPEHMESELLRCGRLAFARYEPYPAAQVWWWPRYRRLCAFIMEEEKARRPLLSRVCAEVAGRAEIGGLGLIGRADRIEQLRAGGVVIVDYKTGGTLTQKALDSGYGVQLTLLALIAAQQGWRNGPEGSAVGLEYWQIQGSAAKGAAVLAVPQERIAVHIAEAEAGLARLAARFSDPATPYTAHASRAAREGDYDHLARMAEWL